ncbi:hypothetical protein AAEX28_06055 [Lentisphaerota bacterium WC36G]|nr:hypothetical protein LJT99_08915 [Lentisphaerae bacterium WC36]
MKKIIEDCLKALNSLLQDKICQREVTTVRRVQIIINALSKALREDDIQDAIWIIIQQLEILSSNIATPERHPTYNVSEIGLVARKYAMHSGLFSVVPTTPGLSALHSILKGTHQKIFISFPSFSTHYLDKSNPAINGVQKIHRIWLGKTPSDENLTLAIGGNLAIKECWVNMHDGVKTPNHQIETILWTNVNELLMCYDDKERKLKSRLFNNFIVKNIDELFPESSDHFFSKLKGIVDSFIKFEEYAFASDVLRFLIMYHHGGLYVDFPYCHAHMSGARIFKPAIDSVKVAFRKRGNVTIAHANTFSPEMASVLKQKKVMASAGAPEFSGYIDSHLLYCGHEKSAMFLNVLKLIERLINAKGRGGKNFPLATHRTKIFQTLPQEWLRYNYQTYDEFLQYSRDLLQINTPAQLTNVFPLLQSMIDYGYIIPENPRKINTKYRLLDQCKIECNIFMHYKIPMIEVDSLNIKRIVKSSWIKPSFSGRPYGEV